MAIPDWLDAAAEDARCALLGGGTAVAATVAASSALTGQIWGVVGGGAATLAFTSLGQLTGCAANPGPPSLPGGGGAIWNIGCKEVTECGDLQMRDINGTIYTLVQDVRSFASNGLNESGNPTFSYVSCDGSPGKTVGGEPGFITTYFITPQEGSE